MRMYDIIEKKRDGGELTDEEIHRFVAGYVSHSIPDYQAAALLMAIFLRGMNNRETTTLTLEMMRSGDVVDLSSIPGTTVDKHSTGGVGDKTSLAVVPMLAAMDPGRTFVAKMTGRGLGHTGGTLDKLESIPGFTGALEESDFISCVSEHGAAIIGQTASLVPADKLMYALRDVTATVDSIPLIASSIMSKKLAAGSSCILLDVKVGSGAFMKNIPDAIELARSMVAIGTSMGRRVEALVTNMDRPLGRTIGNALEVEEVVQALLGEGPEDLSHETVLLASRLLALTGHMDIVEAKRRAEAVIADGSAFAKLKEIVAAQGGDTSVLDDTSLLPRARLHAEVHAPLDGYLVHIDTERVGIASAKLGAGRLKLGDEIDHASGITLLKNHGDRVSRGEPVAILHAGNEAKLAEGRATFESALRFGTDEPEPMPLLVATVTKDGTVFADDARTQKGLV